MGRDKALIKSGDQTWCELAAAKLVGLGLPVVFSVRASQLAEYARRFPDATFVVDDNRVPGPLGALVSAYALTRTAVFLLATDMPFVADKTLRRVLLGFFEGAGLETRRSFGGVCYGDEARIEPLCACYSAEALRALVIAAPSLERYDMQQLRELLRLEVLPMNVDDRAALRNVNRPEDLANLGPPLL